MDSPGRLLIVADVVKFAKKNCNACYGQGYHVKLEGSNKRAFPCKCALKNFKLLHRQDIEQVGQDVRWKPGKAPPYPDAPV